MTQRLCEMGHSDPLAGCFACGELRGSDAAILRIDQLIGDLREQWFNLSPDDRPAMEEAVDIIRYAVRDRLSVPWSER